MTQTNADANPREGFLLKRTIQTMHGMLRGHRDVDSVAAQFGVPAERLRVYQQFVKSHMADMLQINFELLHDLLPAHCWAALVDEYFRRFPAHEYELNANAEPFARFVAELAAQGEMGLTEMHAELTLLQWQEVVAYFSAEDASPRPGHTPTLNPTLAVLDFEYPVATYAKRARIARREVKPRPQAPAQKQPERVLLFRDPATDLAVFYRATDDLVFALKMAQQYVSIDDAAEASGLPCRTVTRIVRRAIDLGLLVGDRIRS